MTTKKDQDDDLNRKGRHNDKYTLAQVIDALIKAKGIKSHAAKRLGCKLTTVTRYIDRYPEVAAAMEEIETGMVDKAEGKLHTLINKGNLGAIIFYLKTKGKSRGYSERNEITGPNGGAIPVSFNPEDARSAILRKLRRIAESGEPAEVAG